MNPISAHRVGHRGGAETGFGRTLSEPAASTPPGTQGHTPRRHLNSSRRRSTEQKKDYKNSSYLCTTVWHFEIESTTRKILSAIKILSAMQ